jgi:hypothetical protein
MEEQEIFLPKYFKCSKTKFNSLLKGANALLGFGNELAENYCNPTIDKYGNYYFIINQEVLHHFTQAELDSAVDYESIVLPEIKI